MAEICPTVTAYSEQEYQKQMESLAKFAHRIHIDLTDGQFTKETSVAAQQAWWPVGVKADFHLMFKDPEDAVRTIIKHQPHLIIAHAEADGEFAAFAKFCHQHKVKVGVALLQETSAESILPALEHIDHVLIFSGNLGYQGGSTANLELLNKLSILREHKSDLEVGWDGGVNDQNVSDLVTGGVDVVNVGGFIQKSDNPEKAFMSLQRIADETGET